MKKVIALMICLTGIAIQAQVGAGKVTIGCRAVNSTMMGAQPEFLGTIQCPAAVNANDCCANHFGAILSSPSFEKFLRRYYVNFFKDAQYQYVPPVTR
jgi:hypothetical protein